jgi:SET domain-containing protein
MPKIKHNDHPLVKVKKSGIHGYGAYARTKIRKKKRIIEYVGPKITKKEAEDALTKNLNEYVFTLNDEEDIDGSVDWNIARYINHSCDPNCESDIIKDHVWISAIKDIKEGEELTYNYGYDFEDFETRLCGCGAKNCVGYMVAEEDFKKVKAMVELENEVAKKKKKKGKKK